LINGCVDLIHGAVSDGLTDSVPEGSADVCASTVGFKDDFHGQD
jgi:hypothetical protein